MVLESGEASNGLAPTLKRRHTVRDALLCVRDDRNDRVAQLGKRCSLGLIKSPEVLVDLFLGHSGILKVDAEGVKEALACPCAPSKSAARSAPAASITARTSSMRSASGAGRLREPGTGLSRPRRRRRLSSCSPVARYGTIRSTSPVGPPPLLAGAMLQLETYSAPPAAANPLGNDSSSTTGVGLVLCGGTRTTAPVPGAASSSGLVENSTA